MEILIWITYVLKFLTEAELENQLTSTSYRAPPQGGRGCQWCSGDQRWIGGALGWLSAVGVTPQERRAVRPLPLAVKPGSPEIPV